MDEADADDAEAEADKCPMNILILLLEEVDDENILIK